MPKAARTKQKWSHKKKSKVALQPLGHAKHAPTPDKWGKMIQYGTFQVTDEDEKEYGFSVDDVVRVLPNGRKVGDKLAIYDYWISRILDIRATKESDVWVQIEWFYSARDAAREVPTFDASRCGLYERLRSNHIDYVSSSVFDGSVTLRKYDETSLDQDAILEDDFYYRYTIDVANKEISPAPRATCTCNLPYNPSDAAPDALMHFCPQPACRNYYHSGCITTKGAPPATERDRGFLLRDPDTGVYLELDLMSSASEPPKKRRRPSASHGAPAPEGLPAQAQALLDGLPPVLVSAAAQPIVKGGAFPAGGVVGNITAVLTARRLVFEALRDGQKVTDGWQAHMPDGWQALVDVRLGEGVSATRRPRVARWSAGGGFSKGKGKAKTDDADEVLALECPGCGGPI
ncbi:hypothetical protein B0H17DRAFT_1045131 [Mycena rosella]|uniref:BAH domain-containing protein n=1 Tax=Mycena rosella TaxID=1033263 RepID=A0AAD7GPU5_MYCRO|nr:hypothetical protein B0H17DRAFT_1045131 [Mycena rosella]